MTILQETCQFVQPWRLRWVTAARGLDISLGMQGKNHDLGEDAAVEIHERHVVDNLLGDTGFGVGGNLQDIVVGRVLALAPDFDQAVGESTGLDQFGLERLPSGDVADARHAEDLSHRDA